MTDTHRIAISCIDVGSRYRSDPGDIASLARSLEKHGILHPVIVSKDMELICGLRRLLAATTLGWDDIPARVLDLADPLQAEFDENECRKEFTVSERVAIAKAIERKAGERRGRKPASDKGDANSAINCGISPGQETRDAAAKAAGFGNRETYRQAERVVASGAPELVEAVDDGTVSVQDAAKVADRPADVQRRAVEKVRNGQARTAAAAADAESERVVDDSGATVPDSLVSVFQAVPLFRQAASVCQKAAGVLQQCESTVTFEQLDHYARADGGDRRVYSTFCLTASKRYSSTRPALVCPECAGRTGSRDNDPCKRCADKGWLTVEEVARG